MDGIEISAPGFCEVNQQFDANSEQASEIEVIKGPATALYGSNAMHGVIIILIYTAIVTTYSTVRKIIPVHPLIKLHACAHLN